jgi:cyclic pyranopterin phosphate synthase
MPLDAQGRWTMDTVVPGAEIHARVHAVYPLRSEQGNGSEPATVHHFADGRGSIGIIASVSQPFCDSCNRVRITADGHLRTCLFSLTDHDLKGLLRSGASDEDLADFIIATVWKKEAGHKINQPDFVQPDRSMSAIGG